MNTTKNTEKKSRKTTKPVCTVTIPPVVEMAHDKVPYPGFVENRNPQYMIKYIVLCLLVGFLGYFGVQKYKLSQVEKPSPILSTLNVPQEKTQLVEMKADNIRDAFDTAEENFIESQTGREFSKRDDIIFQDNRPTINAQEAPFKEDPKQSIQNWLARQHIQGVAYKDFESCIILNKKIFHLGDLVFPEQTLIWYDIDPVEKKLFFSDGKNNLYTINY